MKIKITDKDMKTHKGCQWVIGEKKTIKKEGNTLCSDEVFHFYDSPKLAVLLNPEHGNYDAKTMRLWEIEGDEVAHDGLKGGSKWQILKKEIPIPNITLEQKVEFAIQCAKLVNSDKEWNKWGQDWLDGKDRSASAAESAAKNAFERAKNAVENGKNAEYAAESAAWAAVYVESAFERATWADRRAVGWVASSVAEGSESVAKNGGLNNFRAEITKIAVECGEKEMGSS